MRASPSRVISEHCTSHIQCLYLNIKLHHACYRRVRVEYKFDFVTSVFLICALQNIHMYSQIFSQCFIIDSVVNPF